MCFPEYIYSNCGHGLSTLYPPKFLQIFLPVAKINGKSIPLAIERLESRSCGRVLSKLGFSQPLKRLAAPGGGLPPSHSNGKTSLASSLPSVNITPDEAKLETVNDGL